jgi:ParB/RepB/Spo0J family partition protein
MAEASQLRSVKVAEVSHGENYRKVPVLPPATQALLRRTLRGYAPGSTGREYSLDEEKLLATLPEDTTPRNVVRIVRLSQMVLSVASVGVLHPPTVTPTPRGAKSFRVLAGERRWYAVRFLGWPEAIVAVRTGTPAELRVLRAIENLQRQDPDPFEDGEEFDGMLRDSPSLTQAELAGRLGRSVGFVSQRLSVFRKSCPQLRQAFEDGYVNATDVREMCLMSHEEQVAEVRRRTLPAPAAPAPAEGRVQARTKASADASLFTRLREAYDVDKLRAIPRESLLAGLANLVERQEKMSELSDAQAAELRGMVWALEWVLGAQAELEGLNAAP